MPPSPRKYKKHPLEDKPYRYFQSAEIGHLGGPDREENEDAWRACTRAVRDYDEKLIQSWRMDMDTTLVFAALFSAILTAFVLESYQWLSEDPNDVVVSLLTRIATQLEDNDPSPAPFMGSDTTYAPNASHIAINALWFASLVMTLHTVLMSILVKQWLAEYVWTVGSKVTSPHQTATLRQFRFAGLTAWKIPHIIHYLPVNSFSSVSLSCWPGSLSVELPNCCGAALDSAAGLVCLVFPQAWLVHRVVKLGGFIYIAVTSGRMWEAQKSRQSLAPRGWVDAALQYFEEKEHRTALDAALLGWIHSSLVAWDPSLSWHLWKCAITLPVEAFHPLFCRFAEAEYPNGRGVLDTENLNSAGAPPARLIYLQRRISKSAELLADRLDREDGDRILRVYNIYLDALLRWTYDITIQDSTVAEYIAVFRVFHFRLLPKRGVSTIHASIPANSDPGRLSKATCVWAGLLDEKEICEVLEDLSRRTWVHHDGDQDSPVTDGSSTRAYSEVSALVNAALSRATSTAPDSGVFLSLIQSTLLMSRRLQSADFAAGMAEQMKRLITKMRGFVHASSEIHLDVLDRWVPLLQPGGELSVTEEWEFLWRAGRGLDRVFARVMSSALNTDSLNNMHAPRLVSIEIAIISLPTTAAMATHLQRNVWDVFATGPIRKALFLLIGTRHPPMNKSICSGFRTTSYNLNALRLSRSKGSGKRSSDRILSRLYSTSAMNWQTGCPPHYLAAAVARRSRVFTGLQETHL
ncbi:hypothetical protein BDZ89DRAFT_1135572 [Hymenopellis radicata]|nr:hypothetical protein BDZ89DRAFT_1135572 [Hymenopellis radicata]